VEAAALVGAGPRQGPHWNLKQIGFQEERDDQHRTNVRHAHSSAGVSGLISAIPTGCGTWRGVLA